MSEFDLTVLMANRRGPLPKPARKKASKYHNVPTTVEGIKFQSKREASRWQELRLEEKAGLIADLQRQVSFDLKVHGHKICRYVSDFSYVRDGVYVVEDVKSGPTITPVYRLKKKLMLAVHGIAIQEVM